MSGTNEWPEWLSPEHSAIHTGLEQEILKALDHCYSSADAALTGWTTEGWISCSASNIMGFMRRHNMPAPTVAEIPRGDRLTREIVEREWQPDFDEPDFEDVTSWMISSIDEVVEHTDADEHLTDALAQVRRLMETKRAEWIDAANQKEQTEESTNG